MGSSPSPPLVAVDIGNNRIKLGWFDSAAGAPLPLPSDMLHLDGRQPDWQALESFLANRSSRPSWWVASVNRPTTSRLLEWLRENAREPVTLLAADDLPLAVALDRPDMVGIDRLLDALAANHLRSADRPAVVVDIGTAITVDLVSASGRFLGGAIAPGIAMSARALHTFTDLLPLLDMSELTSPPPAAGDSTVAAMRAGLFWGAVGTIRQLVDEMARSQAARPQVFLTGGAGPAVAELLGTDACHVPHLTLSGIVLAATRI